MNIVDYEIIVNKLVPPMGGGRKFYATMQFVIIQTPNGNQYIDPKLGETYGKDENEARSKMQIKFDKWKIQQF